MANSFHRTVAVRHTRLLLVKAGLTEREADTFLERLHEEITLGNLRTEQDQTLFCERHLREIASTRDTGLSSLAPHWGDLKTIIVSGLGSSLGAALWAGSGKLVEARQGNDTARRSSAELRDEALSRWMVEWVNFAPAIDWKAHEHLLRTAAEGAEQAWGLRDERTAKLLMGLGRGLDGQGRYAESGPLLEQVCGIEKLLHGLKHPHTGIALIALGLHYYYQHQYVEATHFLRQGLSSVESGRGADHMDTAGALYNLAVALDAAGRHAEAEPLLRRSMAIMEKVSADRDVPNNYTGLIQEQLEANARAQSHLTKRRADAGPKE
jgi:tetratricopeptide (TPR) repeat protein